MTVPTATCNKSLQVPTVDELEGLLARLRAAETFEHSRQVGERDKLIESDVAVLAADAIEAQAARIKALEARVKQCGDQFQFYANEHTSAGKTEKAATNQRFADLARAALTLNRSENDG